MENCKSKNYLLRGWAWWECGNPDLGFEREGKEVVGSGDETEGAMKNESERWGAWKGESEKEDTWKRESDTEDERKGESERKGDER